MTSHLNRRTVLLAVGQGMAAVVLAACGTVRKPAAEGSTAAAAPSTPAPPSGTIGPKVTVPALSATGSDLPPALSATTGTRLPLTTITTTVTTTPAPPTSPATIHSTAASTSSESSRTTASSRTTESSVSSDSTKSTESTSSADSSTTSSTSSASTAPRRPAGGPVAGKVVAIDPGHNGGNSSHPEIVNQPVDGGYGYTNTCNTTGTETNDGYAEHAFTWKVANYLRPLLEAKGITTVMTRDSDVGVGPCTPVRARTENKSDADAVVSIHGDGVGSNIEGFYVLTAQRPPAGAEMGARSLQLARAVRDAMENEGFPPSNTLGSKGLWTRDDLTGLNKSTRPKILIECGNMRNAEEAGWMSSDSGQKRYARALANGVIAFLQGDIG